MQGVGYDVHHIFTSEENQGVEWGCKPQLQNDAKALALWMSFIASSFYWSVYSNGCR